MLERGTNRSCGNDKLINHPYRFRGETLEKRTNILDVVEDCWSGRRWGRCTRSVILCQMSLSNDDEHMPSTQCEDTNVIRDSFHESCMTWFWPCLHYWSLIPKGDNQVPSSCQQLSWFRNRECDVHARCKRGKNRHRSLSWSSCLWYGIRRTIG